MVLGGFSSCFPGFLCCFFSSLADFFLCVFCDPGFVGCQGLFWILWILDQTQSSSKINEVKSLVVWPHGILPDGGRASLNWRTLPQEYRTVLASGFAGVKHFLSGPFGIMSAFKSNRSPDQNNESNRLLKRKLQELGYGFIPGRGVWVGAPEKSLFIVGIDQPSLQKLSEEFGQQSYVIGDEGKYKIVDTNSGDLWGKGNTKDDFHQFSEEEVKGMESGPSEKKNYSRSKGRTLEPRDIARLITEDIRINNGLRFEETLSSAYRWWISPDGRIFEAGLLYHQDKAFGIVKNEMPEKIAEWREKERIEREKRLLRLHKEHPDIARSRSKMTPEQLKADDEKRQYLKLDRYLAREFAPEDAWGILRDLGWSQVSTNDSMNVISCHVHDWGLIQKSAHLLKNHSNIQKTLVGQPEDDGDHRYASVGYFDLDDILNATSFGDMKNKARELEKSSEVTSAGYRPTRTGFYMNKPEGD